MRGGLTPPKSKRKPAKKKSKRRTEVHWLERLSTRTRNALVREWRDIAEWPPASVRAISDVQFQKILGLGSVGFAEILEVLGREKKPAKRAPTKKKPAKKKPRASAKGKAALAADSEAWVREYRATLSELAVRVREAAKKGKMSPLEMVGAMRAMAEAVNDRDGILQPLEGEP